MIIIEQDPAGGAIQILILARPKRPKKSGQAQSTQEQSHRNEIDEYRHDNLVRPSLRAFAITRMEEDDIASAAISGVTNPITANGTAARL